MIVPNFGDTDTGADSDVQYTDWTGATMLDYRLASECQFCFDKIIVVLRPLPNQSKARVEGLNSRHDGFIL